MTRRSVTHGTFTIERTYAASPARVFKAWADPGAKARWFGCSDEWESLLDAEVRRESGAAGKESKR